MVDPVWVSGTAKPSGNALRSWLGFAAPQKSTSALQTGQHRLYHGQPGPVSPGPYHKEATMKSETKLAHLRGSIQKLHISNVIDSARKVLESTVDRLTVRPLRDIDGWSDQAEVAFYEECRGRRA